MTEYFNFIKIIVILAIFVIISFVFFDYNLTKADSSANKLVHKCEPFNKNAKNFRAIIDNIEYPLSLPLYLNKTINFECLNSHPTRIPKILFWTPFFGNKDFAFGLGYKKPFLDNLCPVYNCEVFNNKSRLNEADFVIVHMRDTIAEIPRVRPLNQRWIFTVFESPMHCPDFTKYNNVFNFTSTYSLESEFSRLTGSYQSFEWALNESFNENRDFSENKTHFAAAVVGNCGGSSGRLEYIRELQKYVPVNLLGRCGTDCTIFFKNSTRQKCKELIAQSHKFYLSFENSICNGYISEKFFQILRYDIIPIVLGGGNYSHFVPKSGYINVLDYKSPKDLADYLKYLSANKTAYNSYFKWKKNVHFKDKLVFSNFCDMCIQLNLENYIPIRENVIRDIGGFWNKKKNCKRPKFDKDKNFILNDL
ncbi:unnamed protein product [Brachionus calyciflorus]|uniref:Fucosyltransferase n=1 Tax=Brachionus calyciflorus TaxID=104777 RepID=A0A813ZVJ8_9BILA|nr:unnamed protein product [Brachionus calyciflorus]